MTSASAVRPLRPGDSTGPGLRSAWRTARAGFLLPGCLLLAACSPSPEIEIASAATEAAPAPTACPPGSRDGKPGATDDVQTPEGVRYNLRAPANYDAARAHPLVVVYAPAGHGARANEALTQLTHAATARGWLVAYAASLPLAHSTLKALSGLPAAVGARWCVDPERIYATGHSDGGTVSTAVSILPDLPHPFAAIAPSAAGFTGGDLSAYACPAPRPVRVLHNADDAHFPGFGAQAAGWWARCNACSDTLEPGPGECRHYPGCAAGAAVEYCEGPGDHRHWPATASGLLDFFSQAERPGGAGSSP